MLSFYANLNYLGAPCPNRYRDLKVIVGDNYDQFVTDKRLKLDDIQKWLKDKQNDGKFYLGEFSPFLTSGSTGINAVIIYHRRAVDVIQATLFANYPFQTRPSVNNYIQTFAGYLFRKRPRIAVIGVPRGNVERFFKGAPWLHRLFINPKLLSLFDPLDQIVKKLNKFQPDQLAANAFFIALLAQEQIAGRLHLAFKHPMAYVAGFGEILLHKRAVGSLYEAVH